MDGRKCPVRVCVYVGRMSECEAQTQEMAGTFFVVMPACVWWCQQRLYMYVYVRLCVGYIRRIYRIDEGELMS